MYQRGIFPSRFEVSLVYDVARPDELANNIISQGILFQKRTYSNTQTADFLPRKRIRYRNAMSGLTSTDYVM